MSAAFRVGISRDVLDAKGQPSFGRRALEVLDENPDLAWEYLPEDVAEVTAPIAARYDGLYVNTPRVTRAAVAGPDRRVRVVARHGVGYDSVDVAALTAAGVALTNTPLAVRRPMAVATLTLAFALAGRLLAKDRLVREGRWHERTDHMGTGLAGRTLAVVGAGGIGREILGLARPFFGRLLAADPHGDAATLRELGAELVDLDAAMAGADFLVVCCLLDDATRHLIDAARLRRMKPTAYLINVARGAVVDQAALAEALREGRIAGAGLDVFEREPIEPDSPLLAMGNVVLSPHALGWTDECFHDIAAAGLKSLVDVSLGRRPAHLVNPEVWR